MFYPEPGLGLFLAVLHACMSMHSNMFTSSLQKTDRELFHSADEDTEQDLYISRFQADTFRLTLS